MRVVQKALTFDDVLLVPAHSAILPREVSLHTRLTRGITLNIPEEYRNFKRTFCINPNVSAPRHEVNSQPFHARRQRTRSQSVKTRSPIHH